MTTEKLLHGHRAFRKMFSAKQEVFTRLAREGQKPSVLWIGCSDSRVIPEQITSAGPGELFVMRNIANIVPPSGTMDGAVGAVIEYAVLHLQVAHIVICGHTECGGIKALDGHVNMQREPNIAGWVELARPARAQVEALGLSEEVRYPETIKRNVLLQRGNLLSYTCVQGGVNAGKLVVHCWLFDIQTGELLAYDDELELWKVLDVP